MVVSRPAPGPRAPPRPVWRVRVGTPPGAGGGWRWRGSTDRTTPFGWFRVPSRVSGRRFGPAVGSPAPAGLMRCIYPHGQYPVSPNPRENGTTVTFNNYAIGFFRRSKDADELLIQHIATSLGTLPRGSCGCPSRHAPRKVASDTPSRRAAFCRLRLRAGKVGSSIWYDQCACPPERRDQPSSGLCAPDRTGLSSRSSYQNGPRQGSHRYRHPSICVVQLCAI